MAAASYYRLSQSIADRFIQDSSNIILEFKKKNLQNLMMKAGSIISEDEAEAILFKFYNKKDLETHFMKKCIDYISSLSLKWDPTKEKEPSDAIRILRETNILYKNPYNKDTLLALIAINRFANEHKIRVEDALTVFQEYCA